MAFRSDPEARVAFFLTQQFLPTGHVAPALGELWAAAYLNALGDDFYDDLLGFSGTSDERLDGAATVDSLNDCAWNDREDHRYDHGDHDHGDLLGFFDDSHGVLADEPVGDLCDSTLDYLPGDIEGDDDDDWFGDESRSGQNPPSIPTCIEPGSDVCFAPIAVIAAGVRRIRKRTVVQLVS